MLRVVVGNKGVVQSVNLECERDYVQANERSNMIICFKSVRGHDVQTYIRYTGRINQGS